MKIIYFLLAAAMISATACRTKDGAPGPDGTSGLSKQGVISGVLSYVDNDGKPLKESFSYEYFETLSDAYYTTHNEGEYSFRFNRRDVKDSNKNFEFTLYGDLDQEGNPVSPKGGLKFSYVSVTNNNLFSFEVYGGSGGFLYFNGESGTTGEISNFSFNKETGRLIFDYNISIPADNINYWERYDDTTPAQLDGRVDVVIPEKKQIMMVD